MFHKLIVIIFFAIIGISSFAGFVPDILTGEYGETILGKGNPVAAAISPDNKTLVTGTNLGLLLWNINEDSVNPYKFIPAEEFLYMENFALKAFFNYPYCLQFIDNEIFLAGVNALSIFSVKDGSKESTISLDQLEGYRLPQNYSIPVVSSDSKWIFTCQSAYKNNLNVLLIKKWNMSTGKIYSQCYCPYVSIENGFTDKVLYITKDNKYLLILADNYPMSELLISDIEKWKSNEILENSLRRVSFKNPNNICSVQCGENPDNLCIITCDQSSGEFKYDYHLYSFSENRVIFQKELFDSLQASITFNPQNGECFIYNGLIMNVSDATPVARLENTIGDNPIEVNRIGNLFYGFTAKTFYLWDSNDKKSIWKSSNKINFPYGSSFAASPVTNQININDLMYNPKTKELKQLALEGSYTLKFSTDGKKIYRTDNLFYNSQNTNIFVCDSESGNTLKTIKVNNHITFISPDDKTVWVKQDTNFTDPVKYEICSLETSEIVNHVTLNSSDQYFSQVKISPKGDEILFLSQEKCIAVPYPSLEPVREISIKGYSVEYGDNPDELYYSSINNIQLFDRKTENSKIVLNYYTFFRNLYKIKNTPYMMTKWQIASGFYCPAIFDLQKSNLVYSIPLSEDQYLVFDNDKKVITNCLDGTVRIWDIDKLINGNSSIPDYQLYSESQR